uniref:Vacuolar protein 14 C-terminal Fig4-binding domain-containing protein n=1 Tax=Corethron hystrix TaxID=216773 RepID=A0A7S1B5Y5_9STRA
MMSRLCALQWIVVLYENVVPDELKAEYAREFITPLINQLVYQPPAIIVFKSFEVLAKITIGPPVPPDPAGTSPLPSLLPSPTGTHHSAQPPPQPQPPPPPPPVDANAFFALDILDSSRRAFQSRDRTVFSTIIKLHSFHHGLLPDLSKVIEFMCTLQPPEFVYLSFALELDAFVRRSIVKSAGGRTRGAATQGKCDDRGGDTSVATGSDGNSNNEVKHSLARDLDFVSSFVQQMNHVLLTARETSDLRNVLRDCIGPRGQDLDERKVQLFHILLNAFSHNLVAMLSLCLWAGAFETGSIFLHRINPLDINLMLYLEIDQLIELLERPLFRHLHLRMFEDDETTNNEGSGLMLFWTLQRLLMILPQSTGYSVLKNRMVSVARYRQSGCKTTRKQFPPNKMTGTFVQRIEEVRKLHCEAKWGKLRSESLEQVTLLKVDVDVKAGRRGWVGYMDEADENRNKLRYKQERESMKLRRANRVGASKDEFPVTYSGLDAPLPSDDEPDPVISDDEDGPSFVGDGDGSVSSSSTGGPLRHPDDVLPKDQLKNFKKLARKGFIHEASKTMLPLDVADGSGSSIGEADGLQRGSEMAQTSPDGQPKTPVDGPGKWKDFWINDDNEDGDD